MTLIENNNSAITPVIVLVDHLSSDTFSIIEPQPQISQLTLLHGCLVEGIISDIVIKAIGLFSILHGRTLQCVVLFYS